MIAREVPVQDVLRVVLQSGTQNLEEVVVTAIGMKKQEKALGYAASTVKSEDLNAAKSGSVMSGLTGKVAGLNITSGGATGSSQKVIVRGISSFSANQPLYVVDGVPIMNDFQGEDSFSNSVDFGNQANDINPEDVESVTVLKGASATPNDIPAMITHVLPIHDRTCLPPLTREEFMSDTELIARLFPTEGIHACEEVGKVRLPVDMNKIASLHEVTLRMEHVKIRYGSRTILKDLDWEIKNGEKWALFGPNGAGKSTLLSLVYADNPQSYANTLYLFDRKRGSGESIWDIKKRIGYVSPEMHLYYKENVPTLNIVGSGFFDSIGLFRKCNAEQETVALEWMKVFGIEHLKDRLFLTLSSGEQRLALLARAFVKDPDLIILDEPLHGLDVSNKKKAAAIIEQFCDRPGKTLIYVTHYPHELPACVDKRFELVKHS